MEAKKIIDQFYNKDILNKLVSEVVSFIPTFVSGIVIFFAFWWLSKIAKNIVLRIGKSKKINEALVNFMSKFTGLSVFVFGIVTALGTIGVDVTTLTASLGLTGFALGFALKDTISNMVAGIMVIIYRTFKKGDFIKVSGIEGHVNEINLRYTVLDTTEDKIAYIPNSMLFSKDIQVTKKLSITSTNGDDGYAI